LSKDTTRVFAMGYVIRALYQAAFFDDQVGEKVKSVTID
jgi:hypothetical protein